MYNKSEKKLLLSYEAEKNKRTFPITFPILEHHELQVFINGKKKHPNTDYSIEIPDNPNENSTLRLSKEIKFSKAMIDIFRTTKVERLSHFHESGQLHSNVLNEEFNNLIEIAQNQEVINSATLKVPLGEKLLHSALPCAEKRAGRLLTFNQYGHPTISKTTFTSLARMNDSKWLKSLFTNAKKQQQTLKNQIKIVEKKIKKNRLLNMAMQKKINQLNKKRGKPTANEQPLFTTPGFHQFQIPNYIDKIHLFMVGAGGAGGSAIIKSSTNYPGFGGGGAAAVSGQLLPVVPGETLSIHVAGPTNPAQNVYKYLDSASAPKGQKTFVVAQKWMAVIHPGESGTSLNFQTDPCNGGWAEVFADTQDTRRRFFITRGGRGGKVHKNYSWHDDKIIASGGGGTAGIKYNGGDGQSTKKELDFKIPSFPNLIGQYVMSGNGGKCRTDEHYTFPRRETLACEKTVEITSEHMESGAGGGASVHYRLDEFSFHINTTEPKNFFGGDGAYPGGGGGGGKKAGGVGAGGMVQLVIHMNFQAPYRYFISRQKAFKTEQAQQETLKKSTKQSKDYPDS